MTAMLRRLGAAALLVCAATIVTAGPIHDAARDGDAALVQQLLAQDPDLLDARNKVGETPLIVAAGAHQADIVGLLVRHGADVTAADDRGITALHWLANHASGDAVRMLVARGADVNATDLTGRTPLHRAADRLNEPAIDVLLKAGANPNAQDALGRAPLHLLGESHRSEEVVAKKRPAMLVRFAAAGADLQLCDKDGTPALVGRKSVVDRGGYPTYSEIESMMQNWATNYPSICQLHEIGRSVQNRPLWALNITDNPGVEEDEPEFKYVSTMHGDEWTCMVMCLEFIDHLLTNYGSDPQITYYVDEIDIWIMPVMNPDGYVVPRRTNANGYDLNRSFPEWTNGDANTTAGKQAEVAAIMEWTFDSSFVLSANMHTGALLVNYPYDNDGVGSGNYAATPDDDMFIYISEEYSRTNLPMWNGSFYHGITNGSAWYETDGCMQDWHYRYESCNEVTLELSDTKIPNYSEMPGFWDDNRDSMLNYMATCLIGVRGIVYDAQTGDPLAATVMVADNTQPNRTDPDVGDYHRMLLPGTYDLTFTADGYDPVTVNDVVVNAGAATRLDVPMGPGAAVTYPNGGETLTAGTPVDITWTGNAGASYQVQYTDNHGESGLTIEGFEDGVLPEGVVTGGSQPWSVVSGGAQSGTYSAQAGPITHNQSTWLSTVAGEGMFSFWYKRSTETNYDWFRVYIDGIEVLEESGYVNWRYFSTTLGPGEHSVKWEYVKDGSVNGGQDTVWVDSIYMTTNLTEWHDVGGLTDPGVTSVSWTPDAPGTQYKVRVRPQYAAGFWGSWDESDALFEVAEVSIVPGDTNCDGSVDFGDINPFVTALSGQSAYEAAYPDCDWLSADCNDDGVIDFADINAFVAILGS